MSQYLLQVPKIKKGSEIKVKLEYIGKEDDEMRLKVTKKEHNNKRLVTRQKEKTFKAWHSIQKFQMM
jgi:hypothetical protein